VATVGGTGATVGPLGRRRRYEAVAVAAAAAAAAVAVAVAVVEQRGSVIAITTSRSTRGDDVRVQRRGPHYLGTWTTCASLPCVVATATAAAAANASQWWRIAVAWSPRLMREEYLVAAVSGARGAAVVVLLGYPSPRIS
jgi:hypothetical protein